MAGEPQRLCRLYPGHWGTDSAGIYPECPGGAYGEFITFVVRKTKKQASAAPQASAAVSARYMVIDANDSSEWTAFSYDTATGVFTMYQPETDNGEQPYSYRRFLSDGRLEVKHVSGDYGISAHDDIWTPDAYGHYWDSSSDTRIQPYVTDGMKLFLQKIR